MTLARASAHPCLVRGLSIGNRERLRPLQAHTSGAGVARKSSRTRSLNAWGHGHTTSLWFCPLRSSRFQGRTPFGRVRPQGLARDTDRPAPSSALTFGKGSGWPLPGLDTANRRQGGRPPWPESQRGVVGLRRHPFSSNPELPPPLARREASPSKPPCGPGQPRDRHFERATQS